METAQTGTQTLKSQLLLWLHAVQQEEITSGEAGTVVCQGPVDGHVRVCGDEWSMCSIHMVQVSVLLDTLGRRHCGLC